MAGFSFGSSSSSSGVNYSFKTSNKTKSIPPPPLANSTPKKRVNGAGSLLNKKLTLKTNGINGVNGYATAEGGSPLKRRKVGYMDDEEEDHGTNFSVNGHATGIGGKHSSKGGLAEMKELKKRAMLQEQRRQLPIAKGRDALIREFKENDTVILVGETGSGKTTQVPQYLLEADICGNGQIAITQPRRVAATSLAMRVAAEQGVALGTRVGYAVRFDEAHGPLTKIKFLTDGMLARELFADPLLLRYNVVVIDEAHERTLSTDLLIANLKRIQTERKQREEGSRMVNGSKSKGKGREEIGPLKVIVMSATLDAEKFSRFFDGAKILYVKGRQHPVKIYYTTMTQTDFVDSALRTFFQIHLEQTPGDVLIFLPGQEEIESLDKSITTYAAQLPLGHMSVLTCPMYASLPQSQQTKALQPAPAGTRKCILATNIAETSITIPGVRYVIDTGKHKEKRHLAGYAGGGLDTLLTQDVCKSSVLQRTGRAGREGSVFACTLKATLKKMPEASVPEILRISMTSSILQLRCLGQNIETLDFMDKPASDTIGFALKSLFIIGALDNKCILTPIGRQMNNFPLEPTLARALLAAREFNCTREVLGIVSVLSASSKLFFDSAEQRDAATDARVQFRHPSGDHLTALAALRAYEDLVRGGAKRAACREWCRVHFLNERTLSEATNIQEQLRRICEKQGIDCQASAGDNAEPVLKSLLRGLVQHVAYYRSEGGRYKPLMSQSVVKIHPGSVLSDRRAPAIMYDELLFTGSAYARGVSAIDPSFISEVAVFQIQ